MRRTGAALAMALLSAACGATDDAPGGAPEATVAPAGAFRTELTMAEFMLHVVDASAQGVWANQGWVYSEAGEEELFPTTEEGWLAVENSAAMVAETGNLMILPGRAVDDDAWIEYSQALYDAGIRTMKAAESRDKEAFFAAGGDIYQVCRACHQRYIVGEEPADPAAPGAPAASP
jgi:hypothetical protein